MKELVVAILQKIVDLLPEKPKWFLFRFVRSNYLAGVFGVLIRGDEVLVVKKRYGLVRGAYQLPGGGMSPELGPKKSAEKEVYEETGMRVSFAPQKVFVGYNSAHRDLQHVFVVNLYNRDHNPSVVDKLEIAEAKFIPLSTASELMNPEHLSLLKGALGVDRL